MVTVSLPPLRIKTYDWVVLQPTNERILVMCAKTTPLFCRWTNRWCIRVMSGAVNKWWNLWRNMVLVHFAKDVRRTILHSSLGKKGKNQDQRDQRDEDKHYLRLPLRYYQEDTRVINLSPSLIPGRAAPMLKIYLRLDGQRNSTSLLMPALLGYIWLTPVNVGCICALNLSWHNLFGMNSLSQAQPGDRATGAHYATHGLHTDCTSTTQGPRFAKRWSHHYDINSMRSKKMYLSAAPIASR